jgi:hypothetical protein
MSLAIKPASKWLATHRRFSASAEQFIAQANAATEAVAKFAAAYRNKWIEERIRHHIKEGVGVSNISVQYEGTNVYIAVRGARVDQLGIEA